MTNTELIKWVRENIQDKRIIDFPDELFQELTSEQADILSKEFGSFLMVQLPAKEVDFFEWLKAEDPEVWEDLWGDTEEKPYTVSLALLPELQRPERGFPVCDLETQSNFYFTYKHFKDDNAKLFIEAILQKIEDDQELSSVEVFVMEIRRAPIDIWRFSYMYNIDLEQSRRIVAHLVKDEVLEYTPTRENLSEYLL